ncbi:MAG: caspase family protein, partial [Desulfobacterales bacterium]
ESGKQILKKPLSHPKGVMTAVFSQDGRYILTGCEDGLARLWDTVSGAELRRFHGHTSGIWQVSLSQNQRYMLSASRDQTVRLWEVATGRELCRLISFRDGSWAVVDKEGRFDASNGGDVRGLHWVVGNETIELHQLKERYYEPGLLSKLFGFNQELLRNVVALRNVALYPALKLKEPTIENPTLEIYLTNRGGGIGKLTISINGKEVSADARGKTTDPEDPISFGLKNQPYLIPGKDNVIEVRAFNAEGYLSSRGVAVAYQPPGEAPIDKPTLWAILAGVSQYEGEDIKLRYAAKDAEAMATALTLGAKRLFGAEKVQITLLSTEPKNFPTRANIKQAFEKVCTAKPWDILVVYLAGHGVALGDTYYYLTQEARSTNLTDPDIRELVAISSDDLVKWIKKSPALKQVMVLDTCAAGAAARKLVEPRNISSDQIRAIERLKDRTGFHVLMGSAADAVSYEATQYEQGLLTYALLQGMRGAALREKEYVDVNRLFQHAADAVPDLATHIGGVHRPVIAAPKGTSFDIGQLNAEDRQQIPLAQSKPILLPPVLLNGELFHDDLNLTDKLRRQLREDSYAAMRGTPRRMSAVYLDADQLTGAIRPSGTYRVEGNNVKVNLVLVKDGTKLSEVQVQGSQTDLRVLIENLVEAIFQAVE